MLHVQVIACQYITQYMTAVTFLYIIVAPCLHNGFNTQGKGPRAYWGAGPIMPDYGRVTMS